MHYVFTVRSLDACLQRLSAESFANLAATDTLGPEAQVIVRNGCIFVIHRHDSVHDGRIVLPAANGTPTSDLPADALYSAFYRIHRFALGAAEPPVRLPPAWTLYQQGNRAAFFATPHGVAAVSMRWIAEIHPLKSKDVVFWKLTMPGEPLRLADYEPPYDEYLEIVSHWNEAFKIAAAQFAVAPSGPPATLEETIDLEALGFGAVTQSRRYSTWLQYLTAGQRDFLSREPSVKLRGPAGSGKTLALELKTLQELYRLRKAGPVVRLLFLTPTWDAAYQVEAALRALDESGGVSEIDVCPLLEIARDRILSEAKSTRDFDLLGENGLSGRRLQLRRLDTVLDHLVRSDWLTYRNDVGDSFRSRVEAPSGSIERHAFVWDLMMEFVSVLSSERLVVGPNAERRYVQLVRQQWMMPLETDAEKQFVFQVYREYIAGLQQDGLLTVDQLMSDFLNYLFTFSWNLARDTQGYDIVFVDELHLLTEQERHAVCYLTRPAAAFPRLFMALDPTQAPSEVYADVPAGAVTRSESGRADLEVGTIVSMSLSTVHRFTPEILVLVQYILRSFPALDLGLGPDSRVDPEALKAQGEHGRKPVICIHAKRADEIRALPERVRALLSTMGREDRLAVITLDPLQVAEYAAATARVGIRNVSLIESRDDIGMLQYRKRSVVVGAAEHLAGLQFECVVIAGLPNTTIGVGQLEYQRGRLLRSLYLAVSRGKRQVEVHVNLENGGLPKVLEDALAAEVVEELKD